MNTRHAVAALVTLVALSTTPVSASSAEPLTKGTIELTPSMTFARNSLSFSGTDVGTVTNLSANGTIGYFLTDNFEVGGGLLVNYQSLDDPTSTSESSTSLGLIAGVQYNFSSGSATVPFVRGAVGFASNSGGLSAGDQTTVIAPALTAGMRILVGSSASVNLGVGYEHRSSALGVQDLSANTFGLDVGVSIFLRRGR